MDFDFSTSIFSPFFIVSGAQVCLFFPPHDRHLAVFIDSNGRYLSHDYVLDDGTAVPSVFIEPTKPGYEVTPEKWNNPLTHITSDTLFILQYEKLDLEHYTLLFFTGMVLVALSLILRLQLLPTQLHKGKYLVIGLTKLDKLFRQVQPIFLQLYPIKLLLLFSLISRYMSPHLFTRFFYL